MNKKNLLKKVLIQVLRSCAQGDVGFGLSYIVSSVSPSTLYAGDWRAVNKSRYTSGSLKTYRGQVQWCLAQLAIRGILYTRQGPEGGVAPYAHGETDKRFKFRITKERAIELLSEMKIPLYTREPKFSYYHTKSLDKK
jgi:hypothetical protein